jgi:hypothetical protein
VFAKVNIFYGEAAFSRINKREVNLGKILISRPGGKPGEGGMCAAYVVVVVQVALFRVSRSAKWFHCPLVYCQGVLISQMLRSEQK